MHPTIPLPIFTDSYKASHFAMYPEVSLMSAYGEFRTPFEKDEKDTRFVFFGMRYIVEKYLSVPWTEEDVEMADEFYRTHNVGFTPFPFPKDLFLKFVRENRGYFPVRIEALPEGSVAHIHTPVYQITAEGEYARLVTFLETILTQIWYPCTVATLSRRVKDLIEDAFEKSVDSEFHSLMNTKLHDFGFRGCTCGEQSILGGMAHLVNFLGTDTMSAAFYAQKYWNNGAPVGFSVPATEHSVMTAWRNERDAILNMIQHFGGPEKVFSVVMDSYDYQNALTNIVPMIRHQHKEKGGVMIFRPDSGNPVECVLQALQAGEANFGATVNQKGYKVVQYVGVIQGDGINISTIAEIIQAVLRAGYSVQNVAFGMGGGLLQKVNRDTMGFATKLSFIQYKDGSTRDVMKRPKTDRSKLSLPGRLRVVREENVYTAYPREDEKEQNDLQVVYDNGPVSISWPTFDEVRARVQSQWRSAPKIHDPISPSLRLKIQRWMDDFDAHKQERLRTQ